MRVNDYIREVRDFRGYEEEATAETEVAAQVELRLTIHKQVHAITEAHEK